MKSFIVPVLDSIAMICLWIPLLLVIIKKERAAAPWLICGFWMYINFSIMVVFIADRIQLPELSKKKLTSFINFQNTMESILMIGIVACCAQGKLLKKTAGLTALALAASLVTYTFINGIGVTRSLPMIALSIVCNALFQLLWLYTQYNRLRHSFSDKFFLLQNMAFIFHCGAFIIPGICFYILHYAPVEDLVILGDTGTLSALAISVFGMARYLPLKTG